MGFFSKKGTVSSLDTIGYPVSGVQFRVGSYNVKLPIDAYSELGLEEGDTIKIKEVKIANQDILEWIQKDNTRVYCFPNFRIVKK